MRKVCMTMVCCIWSDKGTPIYIYTLDGKRMLSKAASLDSWAKGAYIINGKKTTVK